MTKRVYVECTCSGVGHLTVFILDAYEDGEPFLWIHPQMNPYLGFWGRIKAAFKYLFRPSLCNYGHYSESILENDQCNQIIDICNEYKRLHLKWDEDVSRQFHNS